MLGLAAKYRPSDAREGLSTISNAMYGYVLHRVFICSVVLCFRLESFHFVFIVFLYAAHCVY